MARNKNLNSIEYELYGINRLPRAHVKKMPNFTEFSGNYKNHTIGCSLIIEADCLEWMRHAPVESIHAMVTDPPYGVKEYEPLQLEKRNHAAGGIWRLPPAFDGAHRQPLPRFTALSQKERKQAAEFFTLWAQLAVRILRPGGHIFIACNAFLCQMVYSALEQGGLEFRGQLIRTVRTLRGGDRPKNAESIFPEVCSMPRGNYEPWGIFRKKMPPGMRLADCLLQFETGGLRRAKTGQPFNDLITVGRTSREERRLAHHPSLKPQALLRELVYAALPLGKGIVLDPFMGSGATVAAANAMGISCIGIERDHLYFQAAGPNIEKLSKIAVAKDQLPLLFA